MMLIKQLRKLPCALVAAIAALAPPPAAACTRAVYLGDGDLVITARTMDWMADTGTNLWALPRGLHRDGCEGPESLEWTSRYGSLVATAYDRSTVDGMNEKGLVANLLYLAESRYPQPSLGDPRKPMDVYIWTQYVLDNFATVAEAVAAIAQEPYYIVPAAAPNGAPGTMHLAMSDSTGDSAIVEYVDGQQVIHYGRQFQVMTNSPVYDQQLALNDYWQQIGGTTMMPGTSRAVDRFVRASFYINAIPRTGDPVEAVACAFSVIRNVSVPLGISTPAQPVISSTLWRTVADHRARRYFFESTRSPNVFWVDLADLDFSPGHSAGRLDLTHGAVYAGNAAGSFQPAEPFPFGSWPQP